MTPQACQGCSDCGTQHGKIDGEYRKTEPHDYRPIYNRHTGEQEDRECSRCLAHEKHEDQRAKERDDRRAREAQEEQRVETEERDGTTAYRRFMRAEIEAAGYTWGAPHCDDLVLHSPGACDSCDKLPKTQQYRVAQGVAFTDAPRADLTPCFTARRRDVGTIEKWGGNRPSSPSPSGETDGNRPSSPSPSGETDDSTRPS
jgi:hypothetical protein